MTQNQIAYHNALELERHNKATEIENKRHYLAEEAIKARQNELAQESNEISRAHYERQDAINAQHYSRSDTLAELLGAETLRSNRESEEIRKQQNAINAASVAETSRHAKATEMIEKQLAANTVYKTQAEVSYTTANTGLVQAKTRTEGYQPNYILNQTDLAKAKTVTEGYSQTEKESSTIRNYLTSIGDVLGALGKLGVLVR